MSILSSIPKKVGSLLLVLCIYAVANPMLKISGVGWVQAGRIVQSSDTSNGTLNRFSNNWIQNTGGQFTAVYDVDKNWEAAGGLGVIQSHSARGTVEAAVTFTPNWGSYISEARISYAYPNKQDPFFKATVGTFPFNYSPQNKNLGLYLNRGYVYPGILLSGFETEAVLPIASVTGIQLEHKIHQLHHSLIVNSETQLSPYFDLSLMYLFKLEFSLGITLGGGINLYRLIQQNSDLSSLKSDCPFTRPSYDKSVNDQELCYLLDSTISVRPNSVNPLLMDTNRVIDTITGSLSGTKLMGRAELDFKKMARLNYRGSSQDGIFYLEAAVLGLKDYPKYYTNILERIPIMVGFNLPTFGLLDVLSIEAEYYSNQNSADLNKAKLDASWIPRKTHYDAQGDNFKYSLYFTKILQKHIKISGQIANDHLRLGGARGDDATGSEVFISQKDWYWMTKLAFFF